MGRKVHHTIRPTSPHLFTLSKTKNTANKAVFFVSGAFYKSKNQLFLFWKHSLQ